MFRSLFLLKFVKFIFLVLLYLFCIFVCLVMFLKELFFKFLNRKLFLGFFIYGLFLFLKKMLECLLFLRIGFIIRFLFFVVLLIFVIFVKFFRIILLVDMLLEG